MITNLFIESQLLEEEINYRGGEGIVAVDRPGAAADEGVGGAQAAHDADEEADAVVGGVLGKDVAGVGDRDPAAAALGEVDVVDAGAVGDDELERRQLAEELRRDAGDYGFAEDGLHRLRTVEKELFERQWRFVRFEDAELGNELLLEHLEEEAGAEDEELRQLAAAVEVAVQLVVLGVDFLSHFFFFLFFLLCFLGGGMEGMKA